MNWGYKILVVYIVFITGIVFMVIRSSTEKTDLVTSDYYAQELKYQEKIDQQNRSNALSAPLTYEVKEQELLIHFPSDFKGKKIEGDVRLYCPSDEKKDIEQNFAIDDLVANLPIRQQKKGLYELHVSWVVDGLNYYYQKKIFIQ